MRRVAQIPIRKARRLKARQRTRQRAHQAPQAHTHRLRHNHTLPQEAIRRLRPSPGLRPQVRRRVILWPPAPQVPPLLRCEPPTAATTTTLATTTRLRPAAPIATAAQAARLLRHDPKRCAGGRFGLCISLSRFGLPDDSVLHASSRGAPYRPGGTTDYVPATPGGNLPSGYGATASGVRPAGYDEPPSSASPPASPPVGSMPEAPAGVSQGLATPLDASMPAAAR